jgi:hypothetical protein
MCQNSPHNPHSSNFIYFENGQPCGDDFVIYAYHFCKYLDTVHSNYKLHLLLTLDMRMGGEQGLEPCIVQYKGILQPSGTLVVVKRCNKLDSKHVTNDFVAEAASKHQPTCCYYILHKSNIRIGHNY